MRRVLRRSGLPTAYVHAVITAGVVALAASFVALGDAPITGPMPKGFAVFFAMLVVAETQPIKWLWRKEGGEVTASWTFAFALLLVAPPAAAMLAMFSASLLGDALRRKPVTKALFNACQVTLSLGAGALIIEASGLRYEILGTGSPTLAWFPVAALAGMVMFILNGALLSTVLALHQDMRIWPMVRDGVRVNIAVDGMLLALGPIFVVVAQRSVLLIPLLLVTAGAVYRSAHLAELRQYEAEHDQLTGMLNRRRFQNLVAAAIGEADRRGERVALVLLDLDGFKGINDRLGHHVGDLLLREVGERLGSQLRMTDSCARLGGDEFAILLRPVEDGADAQRRTRDLERTLLKPCTVEGFPIGVAGSFGIALFPDDGADAGSLMEHADVAMYAAKGDRLGVQSYGDRPERRSAGRLDLLGELQRAISNDELVLHYQPRVDCRTGHVHSVEALVRWQHPRFGLIAPGEFMPLAEHTDLMAPFSELVVHMALDQTMAWHRDGILIGVAVNGSARNLHDLRFPTMVADALRAVDLDPAWLELEITEHTVMSDPERSLRVLLAMRQLGVSISIDDFGTGYSSLANLRDLPIDHIKIDKSFVGDMLHRSGDALIIQSIIELAQRLGLGTVAEGVESEAVLDALTAMGCDSVQGFYLARPAPADELTPLLRRLAVGNRRDLLSPGSTS